MVATESGPRHSLARRSTERACLMAAVELYRNQLAHNPGPQAYLARRGIDLATAERCRVGYAAGDELLSYLRWRRLPAGADSTGLRCPTTRPPKRS